MPSSLTTIAERTVVSGGSTAKPGGVKVSADSRRIAPAFFFFPSARVYFQFSSANGRPTAAGPKEKVGQSEHRSLFPLEKRQGNMANQEMCNATIEMDLSAASHHLHSPPLPPALQFFLFFLSRFCILSGLARLPPRMRCTASEARLLNIYTHTQPPQEFGILLIVLLRQSLRMPSDGRLIGGYKRHLR